MPVATLSRLERLLAPYRDLSNQEMRAQLKAYLDEHRESRFPSTHTLNRNSRILMAGKRYRFGKTTRKHEARASAASASQYRTDRRKPRGATVAQARRASASNRSANR